MHLQIHVAIVVFDVLRDDVVAQKPAEIFANTMGGRSVSESTIATRTAGAIICTQSVPLHAWSENSETSERGMMCRTTVS